MIQMMEVMYHHIGLSNHTKPDDLPQCVYSRNSISVTILKYIY